MRNAIRIKFPLLVLMEALNISTLAKRRSNRTTDSVCELLLVLLLAVVIIQLFSIFIFEEVHCLRTEKNMHKNEKKKKE